MRSINLRFTYLLIYLTTLATINMPSHCRGEKAEIGLGHSLEQGSGRTILNFRGTQNLL